MQISQNCPTPLTTPAQGCFIFDYPIVTIWNNTPYAAVGEILYLGCSSEQFAVAPGATWASPVCRGLCLLSEIRGLACSTSYIPITPYTSTGTSYASFEIQENSNGDIYVDRIVN